MKVLLKNVRLSYPKLFKPDSYEGSAERYSADFVMKLGDENHKAVKKAIEAVAKDKFGEKWETTLRKLAGSKTTYCLDENLDDPDLVKVKGRRRASDGRPLVIGQNKESLSEEDGKPYGGCYVNAQIDIWAQTGTTAGIRCSFSVVQFWADGERFGGAAAPSLEDFEIMSDSKDDDLE